MTTTVTVKARAWGATVVASSKDGEEETIELGAHEDRNFHIAEGSTTIFTVTHGAEPVAEAADEEEAPVPLMNTGGSASLVTDSQFRAAGGSPGRRVKDEPVLTKADSDGNDGA